MVVVDVVGHDSARLHKIVCVESLSLQAFPFKLAGVAILLALLWTPPLPQVTEQDDHWDHELQMQSDGLASAKKKNEKKLVKMSKNFNKNYKQW